MLKRQGTKSEKEQKKEMKEGRKRGGEKGGRKEYMGGGKRGKEKIKVWKLHKLANRVSEQERITLSCP